MTKLTKIFTINQKTGCYIELKKKVWTTTEYIIIHKSEIKIIGNDIFINNKTLQKHANFFRNVKSI